MTPPVFQEVDTPHRKICTPIPHPDMASLLERLARVESRSMHGQLPIQWQSAEGWTVEDPWGNRWIDFTSTIFVANAGHGHPSIVQAIQDVTNKPLLHAYNYLTEERLAFLEELISSTPESLEKAFLVSAGTEAVEVALKLMRMEAQRLGKRRSIVVTFEGNWHGRTMGAQHLSSSTDQRAWIGHEDPNIVRLPFPYPWMREANDQPAGFLEENLASALAAIDATLDEDVAGFFFETYQGWGAFFYPVPFVQTAAQIAREHGCLMVFDEMQAGFGRTGKMFGYEHYDVEADLICCGKGTSSSLPLAFVLGRASLLDLPEVGSMSSTHSANPLSCAAGLANLRVILREKLIDRAQTLGVHFHSRLLAIAQDSGSVQGVEGRGMVAALIFHDWAGRAGAEIATEIAEACMRQGLLVVHTGRESIKLAPPLTISRDALDEGLAVLADQIGQVERAIAHG